jgi:hypothetical protein
VSTFDGPLFVPTSALSFSIAHDITPSRRLHLLTRTLFESCLLIVQHDARLTHQLAEASA